MFKLCSGSSRMLLGRSIRIALGSRHRHGLFRFLIPSCHARRVRPTMLRFEETRCGIESEPVAIWCMCPESLRMNLVKNDVDVKMFFVVVRDNHILMAFISERFQCVQRAVYPLRSSRTFSWRPCQFIMADSILATIIERCNSLHFSRCRVEAQKILRHGHISSQQKLSGVGVTLLCEVFTKPLEAAGVFARWLHLDDHVYFTSTVLSVLTALRTADNVEFSPFRRPSSFGRPLICLSRYFWSPPILASSPKAFWSIFETIRLWSEVRRMYSLMVRPALLAWSLIMAFSPSVILMNSRRVAPSFSLGLASVRSC